MKRTAACLCWLFAAVMSLTTPAEGKDSQLYVSPQGNDAWSGLLAEPHGEQSDGPPATLEAARLKVRELGSQAPVTVLVREGAYELD